MSPLNSFDFIIVGGGTAGSVLAARLSENPELQVLIIEAGDDQTADPRIAAPAMWPALLSTPANWGFRTTPQIGLGGRELAFTQGRLLGGSSAINGMNFTPNTRANIESWATLGNRGWEWDKFTRSFSKCYTSPFQSLGSDGPIKLSLPDDPENQWPELWYDTLRGLGHAKEGDAFRGRVMGAFANTDCIDPATRQRSYAANGYLQPVLDRTNLTVLTQTLVEKIVFRNSEKGVVADGVQYTKDGETQKVTSSREIILAAGAVNSPRILELSGVGDPELLQRLGIDIIIGNEYVGENFQNHLIAGFSLEVREGLKTMDPIIRQEPDALAAAMDAYSKQTGPLASSGTNPVAHLPLPGILTAEGKSDLDQLLYENLPCSIDAIPGTKTTAAFAKAHEDFVESILKSSDEASGCHISFPGFAWFQPDGTMAPPPAGTDNYLSLALILSHPLSRGSVHITSPSAKTDPRHVAIDPAHFTHPLDIEVMARHLRFLEIITASEPLMSHIKRGGKRNQGAPLSFADLKNTKDYLRRTAVGANHPIGTCSMMSRELGGVVDSNLRVYGCSNLRVCDASIIPILPRANLLATVYGIAEHAAALITDS